MTDRRDFFKNSALLGASVLAPSLAGQNAARPRAARAPRARMALTYKPFTAMLRHVFTIATSSRTTTPGMLTQIAYDGVVGYGEASMPPYLSENQETCAAFLAKVDLGKYPNPFELETILADIDALAPGNTAAKAAVDIALHDLVGKLMSRPWIDIWGYDAAKAPYTSFTIGIDTADVVRKKVQEAAEYKVLKVKLGRDNDHEMIETIRSVTDKPLTADANQGWKDRQKALDEVAWLKERNVLFVEQPFPKETPLTEFAWLTERSPLPIMADESCQRLQDVKKLYGAFTGINIKLMKSTGMREAQKMVVLARSLGLKVMLGCMTETSCAISAASHLSPMVDWADLDGALLISNDPFVGTTVVDGKVVISTKPGVGITVRP
jgi:L-alanine-DL-glutamate epimerase-like enolase superfamily enzyme